MEAMSYAEIYENTFDDFSEMAIQFGYLALFSPVQWNDSPPTALRVVAEIVVMFRSSCHTYGM